MPFVLRARRVRGAGERRGTRHRDAACAGEERTPTSAQSGRCHAETRAYMARTMTQPDFFMCCACARRPSNSNLPFAVSSTHSELHGAVNTKAESQSAGSETPRWLSARPLRYQRRTCVAVLHVLEKGSSSDALLASYPVAVPLVTSSTGQCFLLRP